MGAQDRLAIGLTEDADNSAFRISDLEANLRQGPLLASSVRSFQDAVPIRIDPQHGQHGRGHHRVGGSGVYQRDYRLVPGTVSGTDLDLLTEVVIDASLPQLVEVVQRSVSLADGEGATDSLGDVILGQGDRLGYSHAPGQSGGNR